MVPISKLNKLESLKLTWINISDISFLENNKNIKKLEFYKCPVKDSEFPKFEKLEILEINENEELSDISFLEKNKNIKRLRLSSCYKINNFLPISKLDKLESLNLSRTKVTDISFLEANKKLKELNIDGCWDIKEITFPKLELLENLCIGNLKSSKPSLLFEKLKNLQKLSSW